MNSNIHIISGIIFDVDGVLVDTVAFHFQAWKRVFDEENIFFDKKEYKRINGIPRDAGIRLIVGNNIDLEYIQKIADRKQRYYLELIAQTPPHILPGIDRLLCECRKKGLRIAAASSSKNAKAVLEAAGIASQFDVIITGYDFKKPKPDPDIFQITAHDLGIKPHSSVVVEDAVNGVRAAYAGGFYCLAIANSESADELRSAGATGVVHTTEEITADMIMRLAKIG